MKLNPPLINGMNNPIPEEPGFKDTHICCPHDKDPKDYKYVGKNIPRKDAVDIVTGNATFCDDFKVAGTLIGKVKKSPHPHAMIKSIDTSKAKALKGVHAVLTYEDVPADHLMGWPPQKPYMDKHLRYVGDTVAIVAADTEEIANEAIDLIEVEYEILSAVYDGFSAMEDGAPQLYPQYEHNMLPGGYPPMQEDGPYWHLKRGDADAALEECEYISEETVSFNKMCCPGPPEPAGCIVRWDGADNYTVWAASQGSFAVRAWLAPVMGNPNLRVINFNTGGSYGNKQTITSQVYPACLLAKATCRPVKVFQTKVEQMMDYETRLGSQVKGRIGMTKDGIIHSVKALWAIDTGCYSSATQGQMSVGLGEAQILMAKCKNWDMDSRLVVTNKQPAGVVRGYGGQELNSCLGLVLAKAMQDANMDPVEVYKKNFVSAGDTYIWRDGLPWRAHGVNYVPIIEKAAEKFGWKETWKGWHKPTWVSEDGRYVRGVGVACLGNADVGESNNECYVRVQPDLFGDKVKVIVHLDLTESGMGTRSAILKEVAEILNVPYEWVDIVPPDNKLSPVSVTPAGSRGTFTFGHAVCNAAEDVKRKIFKAAQTVLRINPEYMEMDNGCVVCHGMPGKRVPIRELTNQFFSFTGRGTHVENFSVPSMVICFIEVQVDTHTGKVDIVRMLNGADPGTAIDPQMLEMQMQGGIGSACLDTATFEEHIIDRETGRTMTYDMIEYKWRPFNEFPQHEACLMDTQWDTFQFHAYGVGEIAGGAAACATMMAISDAIGVNVKEYPATPQVILRALGKI